MTRVDRSQVTGHLVPVAAHCLLPVQVPATGHLCQLIRVMPKRVLRFPHRNADEFHGPAFLDCRCALCECLRHSVCSLPRHAAMNALIRITGASAIQSERVGRTMKNGK
jgi:hypothetical protein